MDKRNLRARLWLQNRMLPCFSALCVSASVIFDKSIGRMTLIAELLSPMFFGLSVSVRVGVMAGEEVTDS